ncbi:hypothetical protein ACSBR2_030486 [Camellia fascicularis]
MSLARRRLNNTGMNLSFDLNPTRSFQGFQSTDSTQSPQTSIYVIYSLPIIDQFEDTDLDSASNSRFQVFL